MWHAHEISDSGKNDVKNPLTRREQQIAKSIEIENGTIILNTGTKAQVK